MCARRWSGLWGPRARGQNCGVSTVLGAVWESDGSANPSLCPPLAFHRRISHPSASSGSASRRTATTPTPRPCTAAAARAASGTWPSTSGARPSGAAAPAPAPSTSPHTSCPVSDSPPRRSWPSPSPGPRRSRHHLLRHHHRRKRQQPPRRGTATALSSTASSFASGSRATRRLWGIFGEERSPVPLPIPRWDGCGGTGGAEWVLLPWMGSEAQALLCCC